MGSGGERSVCAALNSQALADPDANSGRRSAAEIFYQNH
jgi:hypothetical protein